MTIAVASGKGGTGKTTVAVTLARISSKRGADTAIIDCDVEAPNANLFVKMDVNVMDTVYVPSPVVSLDRCTGCGRCERICRFNAIALVGSEPMVFQDLCHHCGGCALVCPEQAISETPRRIGVIEEGCEGPLCYAGGRLDIGEAMSPPLINAVKKHLHTADVRIIDAPPGTSCPAVAAVDGASYVVLVAEPTPFGLNDFTLAVGMTRALGIPFGAFINRSDMGDDGLERYCAREGIEVLARIPYSREIAERYSRAEVAEFLAGRYPEEISAVLDRAQQHQSARRPR